MEILENILSNKEKRAALINEFQEEVWNGEGYSNDEKINEILGELAYDLDFYEPNAEWRKESPSYYGKERLEQEIRSTLQKLKEYKAASKLS